MFTPYYEPPVLPTIPQSVIQQPDGGGGNFQQPAMPMATPAPAFNPAFAAPMPQTPEYEEGGTIADAAKKVDWLLVLVCVIIVVALAHIIYQSRYGVKYQKKAVANLQTELSGLKQTVSYLDEKEAEREILPQNEDSRQDIGWR